MSAKKPPRNLTHQHSKAVFSQQNNHETWVRAISDGPSDAWNRFAALFHGQISRASHKVTIVTPYFIPTSSMLDAIQTATLHGVNVDIYLPQILDQKIMQWARMHIIKEAIESGANIYFREGSFSHTKLFLVDNDYCFVGSPNWDPRSLMLNYESGIECHDAALSQALWDYVANIKKSSALYTILDYNAISLVQKIRNSIAWMSSPYL
jgi:cardiolipin synthase